MNGAEVMLTDTIVEDPRWEEAGLETLAERAARAALTALDLSPEGYEIAVLGCDDARIADLNAEFRGKPAPTNVLSWPAEDLAPDDEGATPEPAPEGDPEDPHALGDLAIAFDTCLREAEAGGLAFDAHVTHLVLHGVLHLLGYDHVRDGDARLMERLEADILLKLGIDDPYARGDTIPEETG